MPSVERRRSSGATSSSGSRRSASRTSRRGRRRRADTQYRIGSITKTFTAVGILQLRDAGELSLDDPLTTLPPRERARADDRADARALVRPPARAAGRDLGDDAGAAPRGAARRHRRRGAGARPGLAGGTTRTSRSRCSARSSPARTAAPGRRRCRRASSTRSGSRRTTPGAADPAARGYFVEPYSDAVRLEPDPDLGGAGALGKLWSTTGDLARWGAFLAAGDDRVLEGVDARGDGARPRDGRPRGLEARLGHGARALPLRRPRLRRPRRRHAGPPRGSRRSTARRRSARRCSRTPAPAPRRRSSRSTSPSPRSRRCRAAAEPWQPGEAAPPEIEPLLGRWWVEGSEIVFSLAEGPARGEARRRPSRARHLVSSRPTARIASAASRAASAASCCASCGTRDGAVEKLYFATYPLRREPSTF